MGTKYTKGDKIVLWILCIFIIFFVIVAYYNSYEYTIFDVDKYICEGYLVYKYEVCAFDKPLFCYTRGCYCDVVEETENLTIEEFKSINFYATNQEVTFLGVGCEGGWRKKNKCELDPNAEGCICDERKNKTICYDEFIEPNNISEDCRNNIDLCKREELGYVVAYIFCISDCAKSHLPVCKETTICLGYYGAVFWRDGFISLDEIEHIKEKFLDDCTNITFQISEEDDGYTYRFYGDCPTSDWISQDELWLEVRCEDTIVKEVCE